MAAKTRRSRQDYTDERTNLRAQLETWIEAGFDETDATFLGMARIYSTRNAQLIAMQRPGATEVRGYKAWQTLGRQVRKGEHGIRILAPAGHRDAQPASDDNPDGANEQWFFRLISVFDISQTMTAEEAAAQAQPVAEVAEVAESTPTMVGV